MVPKTVVSRERGFHEGMQGSVDRVTFQLLKSILVPLSFEWLNLTFAVYMLHVLIIDNIKQLEKALSSVEDN